MKQLFRYILNTTPAEWLYGVQCYFKRAVFDNYLRACLACLVATVLTWLFRRGGHEIQSEAVAAVVAKPHKGKAPVRYHYRFEDGTVRGYNAFGVTK